MFESLQQVGATATITILCVIFCCDFNTSTNQKLSLKLLIQMAPIFLRYGVSCSNLLHAKLVWNHSVCYILSFYIQSCPFVFGAICVLSNAVSQ